MNPETQSLWSLRCRRVPVTWQRDSGIKEEEAEGDCVHISLPSSRDDSFKPAISTGFWASASRWVESNTIAFQLLTAWLKPFMPAKMTQRKGNSTLKTTTNNIWVCDFKLPNLGIICYTARASWQFPFCGVINISPCLFSFSLNPSCLAHPRSSIFSLSCRAPSGQCPSHMPNTPSVQVLAICGSLCGNAFPT